MESTIIMSCSVIGCLIGSTLAFNYTFKKRKIPVNTQREQLNTTGWLDGGLISPNSLIFNK